MKWQTGFEKKWIDLDKPRAWELSESFFQKCVLIGFDDSNTARGFSVFEPRDINAGFASKLLARFEASETLKRFELFAPGFIKHRIDALFTGEKFAFLTSTDSSFVELKSQGASLKVRSKLRVVNVDDSPVLLKFLAHTLADVSWVEVVGQVNQSTKAVEAICALDPDFITLDIQMPEMNGVEVLKQLLAQKHFPAIMVSSLNLEEGSLVFEALNSGAFDYLQKPRLEDRAEFKEQLLQKILSAVQGRDAHASLRKLRSQPKNTATLSAPANYPEGLVWCLGASTGGTQALTQVFTSLPNQIPPTLVVQHIPPIFSKAFADSLDALCPFTVKEAEDGEELLKNHVYVAPGGMQMSVEKRGGRYFLMICDDAPVNRFKPSVDYLFLKLAKLQGLHFVGGIFTGMGKDGAQGLLALRQSGARTFSQDAASSVVYGMPRAAFEAGASETVCSLEEAAQTLLQKSLPSKIAA